MRLLKYIILIFILLTWSCTQKVDIGDGLVRIPVYENEFHEVNELTQDTVSFIYGFSLMEKRLNSGEGEMMFGIHLYKENQIISLDVETTVTDKEGKILIKKNLSKPNYPISIGRPSVYETTFTYKTKEVYDVKVHFPNGEFEDININFQYPPRRI